MVAVRAVSADFLHYLYVLSHSHGELECYQSDGAQRPFSQAGDCQEGNGTRGVAVDHVVWRNGDDIQLAADQCAEPNHQLVAEQEAAGLSVLGTAQGYFAGHIARARHGRGGLQRSVSGSQRLGDDFDPSSARRGTVYRGLKAVPPGKLCVCAGHREGISAQKQVRTSL